MGKSEVKTRRMPLELAQLNDWWNHSLMLLWQTSDPRFGVELQKFAKQAFIVGVRQARKVSVGANVGDAAIR